MSNVATTRTTAAPADSVRPPAAWAEPPEHSALELSTGAQTLGEMILRAADRSGGAALPGGRALAGDQLSRSWSSRARGIARGLIALGIEPGDRVSILVRHAPRVDARGRRQLLRGDRRGADLPDQLARGVRVRAAPLRGARRVLRGRDTSWPRSSRSASSCPALEHVIAFNGAGAGLDQPRSADRARDRGARATRSTQRVAAVDPDEHGQPGLHVRARPDRRRAASSPTATSSRPRTRSRSDST